MLSESSLIELSIFRFGVRVFYCRVRVSQTQVRARVRVFPESGFSSRVRVRVRSGFRSMPFTTSFPDVPTVRSMYTYCNDDLRKSSRVVCLTRRVTCLLNLHNAHCKITLISLNHSESFNINIISKASLFYLNLLLNPINCVL